MSIMRFGRDHYGHFVMFGEFRSAMPDIGTAMRCSASGELLEAAEQAFAALVGSHASDDSVQGRARAKLREAIAKATGKFGG